MRIEASEFRKSSIEELNSLISKLKNELLGLRQRVKTQNSGHEEVKVMRKNIARAMTVRTEKIYTEKYHKHKNDRKMPKELRPRLTKAKRMALTPGQLRMVTSSVSRRRAKYPKVFFSYEE